MKSTSLTPLDVRIDNLSKINDEKGEEEEKEEEEEEEEEDSEDSSEEEEDSEDSSDEEDSEDSEPPSPPVLKRQKAMYKQTKNERAAAKMLKYIQAKTNPYFSHMYV